MRRSSHVVASAVTTLVVRAFAGFAGGMPWVRSGGGKAVADRHDRIIGKIGERTISIVEELRQLLNELAKAERQDTGETAREPSQRDLDELRRRIEVLESHILPRRGRE